MRTPLALALALPLAACGDRPDDTAGGGDGSVDAGAVGSVHACVGMTGLAGGTLDPYAESQDSTWTRDVTGRVVSDGPMAGTLETNFHCEGVPMRALVVETEDAETWTYTYAVRDADAVDATPALDIEPGDEVTVRYQAVLDFGQANGWVATDADGALIGAFEAGTWGNALQDGDVTGLTVTALDPIAEVDTDCGPRIHDRIQFTGDDTLRLEPFDTGSVTVGGAAITAFAAIATRFDERVQCTDLAGVTSWAVAR